MSNLALYETLIHTQHFLRRLRDGQRLGSADLAETDRLLDELHRQIEYVRGELNRDTVR